MRGLALFVLLLGAVGAGCLHGGNAPQIAKLEDVLGTRPVRYSRNLVERVRAAGALQDVVGVMDDKARVLIAVARLDDADLTEYQPAAGESGPAPEKRFVRDLAMGFLVHSNLYLNSEPTRQLLAERVRDMDDVRTQLVLAPILDSLLGSATRSAMAMPDAPFDLRATVTSWIGWSQTQLAKPPDPMTHELVLVRIAAIGRFGARLGIRDRAATFFDTIIAAHGEFPLTAGASAARFDLAAAALAARYDLDVVGLGYYIPELARAGEPLDLWAAMRDAPQVARPDADAAFDALVAPLQERVIHYDIHTHTRIRDAFALRGVEPARRTRLLRRLLVLRPDELGAFDTSGLHSGGGTVLPSGPDDIISMAAQILAGEPTMIETDAKLRETVASLAASAFDATGNTSRDEPLVTLHPLFVRWLRAEPEATRIAVLRRWIASIRDLIKRDDSHTFYATEASVDRLIALAALGPGVGLADEVREICEAVIAASASPVNRNTHAILVRAATLARGLLTSS
jgi:hypothetical protein